jgi:GNAT superfamily N-acetyltransferase
VSAAPVPSDRRTPHPLLDVLLAAAAGQFPPVNGAVTVLPPLRSGLEVIVAFTGHAVVATALSVDDLTRAGADGYGGVVTPDVQRLIAGDGGWIGTQDLILVGSGLGDGSPSPLPRRVDLADHPRVAHALAIRDDVAVYADERGLVTVARGAAGRSEISLELEPRRQGTGAGHELLREARRLVPAGATVFAAVAPGNARSLRLFLKQGFTPIGAEIVIRPNRGGAR